MVLQSALDLYIIDILVSMAVCHAVFILKFVTINHSLKMWVIVVCKQDNIYIK